MKAILIDPVVQEITEVECTSDYPPESATSGMAWFLGCRIACREKVLRPAHAKAGGFSLWVNFDTIFDKSQHFFEIKGYRGWSRSIASKGLVLGYNRDGGVSSVPCSATEIANRVRFNDRRVVPLPTRASGHLKQDPL